MTEAALKIEQVLESKLTIDPANLRKHPVRNLAAIKSSLTRFGWQKPIVIDDKNVVIAGNGSLLAARELGMKKVPCVRSSLLGPERVAYAIADNRAAELAEWDNAALLETLQSMSGADVEALGFEVADITDLVDDQQDEVDDDVHVAPAVVAVTRPGDLWVLGDHRLLCGSSLEEASYETLLEGTLADLCSTDPPYMVDYTGARMSAKGGNGGGKDWSNLYNEVEIEDAVGFYRSLWQHVIKHTRPTSAYYCWHAHTRSHELKAIWDELDILPHQTIIWTKPAAILGRSVWLYRHEPALMGWRRGHKPVCKATLEASSVWQTGKSLEQLSHAELVEIVKELSNLWEIDWEGKARVTDNEHPTQKPLEIFARPMRKHTNVGDIVLEPFSGSGSQLIAAEMCQRRCRAIELQPVFVDVAVRRWQRLTGKDATLNGTPWRTVAKKRGIKLDENGTPIGTQSPQQTKTPKDKPARRKPAKSEV